MYRIGLIVRASSPNSAYDAFFDGLHELGYVEGKDIVVERRYAEGKAERYPELAVDLVRLKVDLIVVFTTPAGLARGKVRHDHNSNPNPDGQRSRGNRTSQEPCPPGRKRNWSCHTFSRTQCEATRITPKEVVPRASRVAVLYNAANPVNVHVLGQTQEAARRLALVLQPHEVRSFGLPRRVRLDRETPSTCVDGIRR